MGGTYLCMMPTLETEDVFDVVQMCELATHLVEHPYHNRIIALRIGGNGLMSVVSLRRPQDLMLYDSPMGHVIKILVSVFGPCDLALTAPVCEHIDDHAVTARELTLDMAHGLVGKTAIHPGQIEVIQNALMVTQGEYSDTLRTLSSAQAVSKSQGATCEPVAYRHWAAGISDRARPYGLQNEQSVDGTRLFTVTQYH